MSLLLPKQILIFVVMSLTLLLTCSAMSFTTRIQSNEKFCFYEVFEAMQKYNMVVSSPNRAHHETEVSHINDRAWKTIFYKQSPPTDPFTRVDKLAPLATTYSFCVKNLQAQQQAFNVQFTTGLQIGQLHTLPDSTDSENMQRQLNWLEQQLFKLAEKADSIQVLRRVNGQIAGMVGIKMIVFGVVGIVAIAAVNAVFYKLLKAQFRKRKFI